MAAHAAARSQDMEPALFLKRIDIAGFKSFGHSSTLVIPHGITALVGANGSGKSNVVDAIRWALGEQSARDLRGLRAEDVIFAGRRRSVGMAEVALTFESDASEGDDGPSEVSVARRLYRSGESEYLINRKRVRLRDMSAFLHDIGVGSGRQVVVGQGMADSLLSASPLERRLMVEQAAGLSAYRVRRDEAKQKLALTEQNVQSIESILAELAPRVALLRRQARAVQERDEAKERLFESLEHSYSWKARAVAQDLVRLNGLLQDATRARAQAMRELDGLEETQASVLARLDAWHQTHLMQRQRVHDLQRAYEDGNRALDDVVQDIARLTQARDEARGLGVVLDQSCSETVAELRDARNRQTVVQGKVRLATETVSHGEAALLRGREELLRSQLARSEAKQALRTLDQQRVRAERDREHLRVAIKQGKEGIGRLKRDIGADADRIEQITRDESAGRERLRELDVLVHESTEAVSIEEAQLNRLQVRMERLQVVVQRVQRTLATTGHDLEEARRRFLVVSEHMGDNLLAHLTVPEHWERATASALGKWAYARSGKASARSFHDADEQELRALRQRLNPYLASGAVWADLTVAGLPENLTHPLALSIFCDDDRQAESVWTRLRSEAGATLGSLPLQVASATGRCYSPWGVDSDLEDTTGREYLQGKRRIVTLERRHLVLRDRVERLQEALLSSQSVESSQRKRFADVHAHAGRVRRDAETARDEVTGAGGSLESLRRQLMQEQARIGQLEERSAEDEARLHEKESQLVEFDELKRETERAIEAAVERVDRFDPEQRERAQALEQARQGLRELRVQDHEVSSDVARLEDRQQRDIHELAALRARDPGYEIESEKMRERERAIREQVSVLADRIEAAERDLNRVETDKPEIGGGALELQTSRAVANRSVATHEKILAEMRQTQQRHEALAEEVRTELGVELDSLGHYVGEPPHEAELRRLRNRAHQYSDVDVSVVQESKDLDTRQEHLIANVADMKLAIDGLSRLISEADREMEVRFAHAFALVDEEFGRVFRIMLGGGNARLVVVPGDGGVNIAAQLPGRRSRSSAAFSGGERALIASSLLLAVLRVRPAPFCVLDEVDAALDESNVDRYVRVLQDISRRTQIVVVTHNRGTMATADVLYGVTMDEDGATKILSLELGRFDAAM